MSKLLDEAVRQRRALLRADRELAVALASRFGESRRRLRSLVSALAREISTARAAHETVDALWLVRSHAFRQLAPLTQVEIQSFAYEAERLVARAQLSALARASADARELVAVVRRVEPAAPFLADLVAALSDPARPGRLLGRLPGAAAERMRASLMRAVARGAGAREFTGTAVDALDLALTHALSVARTEHMAAYREGARRAFIADKENVWGWQWVAELSSSTCVVCWGMHGTIHDVEESLDSHWNCRCQAVPLVLGVSETVQTGEELFEHLSAEEKRKILGDAGFEAYKAGSVKLSDFVGVHRTGEFGRMRYARSLKQVLG